MRRWVEVPCALILAAATVFGTGTAIHDWNAGNPGPVLQWIRREWYDARAWSSSRIGANPEEGGHAGSKAATKPSTPAQEHSPRTGPSHPKSQGPNRAYQVSGDGSTTVWSRDDASHLLSIAKRLFQSVQPADITRLNNILSNPDDSAAKASIGSWIQSRLPHADVDWLLQHFQGRTAFDSTDVTLLRQAVQEAEQELTPDERRWVAQSLNSLQ